MRTSTLLAIALMGCTVISDTDRFVPDESCDLQLRLRNFGPHTDDVFEVHLVQDPVEEGNPFLQAVAIFEPLEQTVLNLHMPNAVAPLVTANRPHPSIDFFGDDDSMPGYNFPGDHSWRIEDACQNGPDLFPHDIFFDELPPPVATGIPLEVALCGERRTSPIEVRVYADVMPEGGVGVEERRAIGMYRFTENLRDDFREVLRFPAIFDSGFNYFIDIYVDENANGAFDVGEEAWEFRYRGDPNTDCTDDVARRGSIFDPCDGELAVGLDEFPACLHQRRVGLPDRLVATIGSIASGNLLPDGGRLTNLNDDGPNAWLNYDASDVENLD